MRVAQDLAPHCYSTVVTFLIHDRRILPFGGSIAALTILAEIDRYRPPMGRRVG